MNVTLIADAQEFVFPLQSWLYFVITGLLSVAVPVGLVVVYKLRKKDAPLSAAFVGAGVFLVFAVVLETILHAIMLPLVRDNTLAYVVYAALAAGLFEETGRFIAYKTILRKKTAPETAVMYGLGHGGFEMLYILGATALSAIAVMAMCSSMGVQEFAELSANGSEEVKSAVLAQIQGYAECSVSTLFWVILERASALVLHTALSVVVFKSANQKGKLWLYPAAILLHAAMDVPAALYQRAVLPLWLCEMLIAAVAAAVAVFARIVCGKSKTAV